MKVPNVFDVATGSVGTADTNYNKPPTLGIRHLQFFILFLGLSSAYAMRVNLSVAIVAMTDSAGANSDFPEYDWNEKVSSYLLSSFFWGYVCTQIPSGELARRFGGRNVLLAGTFLCSLLNMLTPAVAHIGNWQMVIVLRVLEGFGQGVIFPCTHTLIARWSCVEEVGQMTAVTYSGSQFGTFVMLGISGILSTSAMGWPSIFYFSGASGLLFCILFFIFGASSPSESKLISTYELKCIESSQAAAGRDESENDRKFSTPWIKLFTSPSFLVLILAHMCNNWGFWTLLTEIPSYMKSVLHRDIKSNALLSALPYFVMFIMCFVFAGISKVLNHYQCLSLNVSRKLFNTIGFWIPMISVIGLGFVTVENSEIAIILLTLTVGFNAAPYLGFQANHIDLSPNFAGIMMGITNCAANIMSICAPLLVGFVVTDFTDIEQWRIVFYIASIFYFVGNLMFMIFGRTYVQPWNDPEAMKFKQQQEASTHKNETH